MANRNKGRRGRSRKRRPATAPAPQASALGAAVPDDGLERASVRGPHSAAKSAGRSRPSSAARRGASEDHLRLSGALGPRPQAPWHPLPLAEVLILVGAVGTVVGLRKGISHGGPPLLAGLAAVVIGTIEVTLREHLSGYRSHTIMLALLPVLVFHSAVVLGISAFTSTPPTLNIALLAVDAALFAFLFKLLRARFRDARRERVVSGMR